MIPTASPATPIPATTSSQKWFAVAMTENHTHAGQSSHNTLKYQRFTISAHGDLDCDGQSVVYYQLVGTVHDGYLEKTVTVTNGVGD